MGDQGPLKVLAEGIGHPLRVGAGLRDLSAARRPLLQPAHWGLSCPRLRAPSHPWVEVAPSWVSGCCPFPREPAQTRVHIHTHGRCRRPHQASVCPHSTCSPGPLASKLAVLTVSPTPGASLPCPSPGPQPHLAAAVPPQGGLAGWGPAVGGQPPWGASGGSCPCTSRALASARAGGPGSPHAWPPSRLFYRIVDPRNAFGKDLFLNTKSAPPASCGNPTFCSPAFWSPRLSSVHRSIRLFICSVLSRGKLGGRKGEERVRKREGRKRNWKGGK